MRGRVIGGGVPVSIRGIRNDDYNTATISRIISGGGTSKKFTFSVFFNPSTESGISSSFNFIEINTDASANFQIGVTTSTGVMTCVAKYAGTNVLQFSTTLTYSSIPQTISISIDLSDTGKRHVYVNGAAASVTWTTYTDSLMSFESTSPTIIGNGYRGNLSDIYFAPNQYIDLSVSANLAKFLTSSGYPADKGATGSLATGTAPFIYLTRRQSEDNSVFLANKGTGGGTFNTSPSGGWVEDNASIKVT